MIKIVPTAAVFAGTELLGARLLAVHDGGRPPPHRMNSVHCSARKPGTGGGLLRGKRPGRRRGGQRATDTDGEGGGHRGVRRLQLRGGGGGTGRGSLATNTARLHYQGYARPPLCPLAALCHGVPVHTRHPQVGFGP